MWQSETTFLSGLNLGWTLLEWVRTLPRELPSAEKHPQRELVQTSPSLGRTQKGVSSGLGPGTASPRHGRFLRRSRPSARTARPGRLRGAPQGEAEGGGRTGGKRPAAPPQSPEEGERRGKHCSSGREKGERRSGERKRLPPRPPMVRPGSGARRRASRMERAEAEGAVRARGRPKGGGAPRAAAQPRPAAPGREPAAPGKGTEEGEGGRPRPGRGPAVRAGPASPHLRRPPPRSTAGLSSSLDPSSPGTGPTAAYPQRIRPSRRRDREGRAPRLPPLCPRAPGSARLPPADRRDRATAAPGASPAPLPSPHPSERRHRRGRRRARSGRVPRRNTEEAEPNGRESESAARLKGTGRPPAGEEERAAPPSPGPARREKPLSVRRGVAERVQPGAVRGGRDSLSRFPCSLSVPLLPSEPPFPQRGSRFLFFFSFFSEDTWKEQSAIKPIARNARLSAPQESCAEVRVGNRTAGSAPRARTVPFTKNRRGEQREQSTAEPPFPKLRLNCVSDQKARAAIGEEKIPPLFWAAVLVLKPSSSPQPSLPSERDA